MFYYKLTVMYMYMTVLIDIVTQDYIKKGVHPHTHTLIVTVGDLAASKKEQQLQAELKRVSGAKDQQISSLKRELQGTQDKLTALREDSEQIEQKMKGEQVRLEMNREHAITGNVLPL